MHIGQRIKKKKLNLLQNQEFLTGGTERPGI